MLYPVHRSFPVASQELKLLTALLIDETVTRLMLGLVDGSVGPFWEEFSDKSRFQISRSPGRRRRYGLVERPSGGEIRSFLRIAG